VFLLQGVPAVITMSPPPTHFVDGVKIAEGCKQLEGAGAAVVGLNCGMGPETMLPLMREIRQICKVC
jgi:methionine synthase I (cobalamin-dependent)